MDGPTKDDFINYPKIHLIELALQYMVGALA